MDTNLYHPVRSKVVGCFFLALIVFIILYFTFDFTQGLRLMVAGTEESGTIIRREPFEVLVTVHQHPGLQLWVGTSFDPFSFKRPPLVGHDVAFYILPEDFSVARTYRIRVRSVVFGPLFIALLVVGSISRTRRRAALSADHTSSQS